MLLRRLDFIINSLIVYIYIYQLQLILWARLSVKAYTFYRPLALGPHVDGNPSDLGAIVPKPPARSSGSDCNFPNEPENDEQGGDPETFAGTLGWGPCHYIYEFNFLCSYNYICSYFSFKLYVYI